MDCVAVNDAVHLESLGPVVFIASFPLRAFTDRPNNRTFKIVPSRLGFWPINKRFTLAHLSCGRPGFRLSCVTLTHCGHYHDYPGKRTEALEPVKRKVRKENSEMERRRSEKSISLLSLSMPSSKGSGNILEMCNDARI